MTDETEHKKGKLWIDELLPTALIRRNTKLQLTNKLETSEKIACKKRQSINALTAIAHNVRGEYRFLELKHW